MNLAVIRENSPMNKHNWGTLMADGVMLGQTLEDPDHYLEAGGEKVYGETAIPRGRYRVQNLWSNHFQRKMPHILDVPGYTHVMFHGGNHEIDTLGCILVGHNRDDDGINDCKGVNQRLFNLVDACERRGEDVWVDVQ